MSKNKECRTDKMEVLRTVYNKMKVGKGNNNVINSEISRG